MAARLLTSSGKKKILLVDGFLTRAEQKVIGDILDPAHFTRTERDTDETATVRQWVLNDLPPTLIEYLNPKLNSVLRRNFPRQKFKLVRSYCNNISYGDMNYPHRDCDPREMDVTAIIYANSKWDRIWGGETVFYDDKGEVSVAVLPKPGRLVLFHGSIEHRAGVPTRDCYQSRLTIALKYESKRGLK